MDGYRKINPREYHLSYLAAVDIITKLGKKLKIEDNYIYVKIEDYNEIISSKLWCGK